MPARRTTILTADDDPQLLRLMTRNLQLEGYEVIPVSDGQQALEEIERNTPDLVLLDVMMPKMDGFSVCQRVREFSSVPIIIVTARGQDQDKVRGHPVLPRCLRRCDGYRGRHLFYRQRPYAACPGRC